MALLASMGYLLTKVRHVLELPVTTAPATPDATMSRIWVDSTTKKLSQLDDAGLLWTMRAPNSSGGMYEYNNSNVLAIDTVNVYHSIFTASMTAGDLDGWTFSAGQSGAFSAIADLGNVGGVNQVRLTTAAPHTVVAGNMINLTSSSVAGYLTQATTVDKSNNFYVVKNVSDSTHMDIVSAALGTATGNWRKGAALVAGADAAGKYELYWHCTFKPANANKTWLFEERINVAVSDKAAQGDGSAAAANTPVSASCFVTIAAGDRVTLTCKNVTDTTDVTIVNCNVRLRRYSR